ncbi:hypothetical protein [Pseudomonas sp. VEM90]
MTDSVWDFGKPAKLVTVALPRAPHNGASDPISEVYRITNHERGCIIRAIRPEDHVDMIFCVRGMRCSNLGSGTQQPRLSRISAVKDRRLKVIFPPQHIAEQIKDKPLGDGACESAQGWGAMRVRMSQPSRLVFEIPDAANWKPFIFLDQLTDWSKLRPIVHRRADVSVAIADQLKAAYPNHYPAKMADLTFAAAQTELVAHLEGPGEDETALEMAGRLIFSPSSAGRWDVPVNPPRSGPVPLWAARLNRAGRASVVALWSTRFEPKRLPLFLNKPEGGGVILSLDRQNHWDIMLQTSLPGWPALRGLPSPNSTDALQQAGPEPEPEPEPEVAAAPRPTVVRPDIEVGFLTEIDKNHSYANQDAGIAVIRPFDEGDIIISALGGLPALAWRGDPPSIFWAADGNPIGVLLERLVYRGYLGRETEVMAVEKGYLFPLGIRASLVTVHERAIYPDYLGDPVSYSIRRRFIVTPRKPRSYPGPYQPYDGRQFPPRRVQLNTLVTPDLTVPVNVPLELPADSDPLPKESIFWPQTVSGTTISDIQFEWSTEDAGSVRSKFIFVMNNTVGRRDAMRALVEYYNSEVDQQRTAWLGGARHRYAEPSREGDTSFDTSSWVLAAQGRRDGPDGEEHFAFDGRMEGANQPPFYPLMDRGYVSMQSIEQMLGLPHGQVEVRYFDGYRDHGIKTPHEIFLTLKQNALALRTSARSDRSGGIASPDLNVAAISRITGPIGGRKDSALRGAELDFSDAAAGSFNPAQFFGDAKLLGVVELSKIVEVAAAVQSLTQAPKLLDETLFGARDDLKLVQAVAASLLDSLYGGTTGLVARLEIGIHRANDLLIGAGLSLDMVYKSLYQAMAPLRGNPAEFEKLLKDIVAAKEAVKIREPIDRLVPKIRALLDAVASVIKDPVPDAFEEIIAKVRTIFEAVFQGAETQARELAARTCELVLEWLKLAFCDAIDNEDFGAILFADSGTLSCAEIFADPSAALQSLSKGLYGAVFEEAWNQINKPLALQADVRARLDLALENGRKAIRSALLTGVALIAKRLALLDPANDDIRLQVVQDRFVAGVLSDLMPLVTPPAGPLAFEQARDFVASVLQRLPDAANAALKARLAELLPTIWPIANVDAKALLSELSELVRREISERVFDPLLSKASALHARLVDAVSAAARSGYGRILGGITALFDAIAKSSAIASLAKEGQAVPEICDAVGNAAKFIGDGVMASSTDLNATAQAIIDAANQIQVPPDPVGRPLRAAVVALIASAERALVLAREIAGERQRLIVLVDTICTDARAYLHPVAAIVRLRRDLLENLAAVVYQCEVIDAIFAKIQPSPGDRTALKDAFTQSVAFLSGSTGIEGLSAHSQILNNAVGAIKIAKIGSEVWRDRLEVIAGNLTALATDLADELSAVADPAHLRKILEGDIRQFQSLLDRDLSGYILQSVGFTAGIIVAIEAALAKAIKPFVGYLVPVYPAVETAISAFLDPLPADPLLKKVYALALGGRKKLEALEDALNALRVERQVVEAIAKSPDPTLDEVTKLIDSYLAGTGALPQAVATITALGLTDVGQNLTEALRDELRQIEEEVRALVLQLVPTKLQTRYFWPSELKRFPDADDTWVFKPATGIATRRPTEPPPGHLANDPEFNWHLWIDGRFSFDIVTGRREIDILGVLRPFELRLLGKNFDMLTISFEETRFTSKNGAAPDFAVTVSNVKIGPFLEFVQKLQSWLAPQGSGFYLKPAAQYPGVEVGYIYDAGIIQLGALQFINVAFRIAAILPFSKDNVSRGEARFVFALASKDRPFLISSPPYGGGGWVTITCTSEQVESLDLAFVFGGVAAIKFGPLDAQGRIVAGIRVQSMQADGGKKAHVVTAIFEAVGEGSIACFSICVSIRVTLTQTTPGGALYGETTYRFSFKVGFVRLKYSVSARYRLSNGSDAAEFEALGSPATPSFIQMTVPNKETEWQAYRRYFDLDLLEDA